MNTFEINITAYECVATVQSCITQLRQALPDAFIRVWDNSSEPLPIAGASEIRWNRFNPSLSRVWNWAIGCARTPWIMITNDDIRLNPGWLVALERDMEASAEALWHGPSRCFLHHRALIERVGWFDERLLGFTYEDLDYIRRMNHAGVTHCYGSLSSLNANAASLKDELQRKCHPAGNAEFMREKYGEHGLEDFTVAPKFSTPDFYPLRPK